MSTPPTHDPREAETLDPAHAAPAAVAASALPARLGAYRVDAVLGQGGMGEVLRGYDERLRRPVALKRMSGAGRTQPDARARFWREARALAALTHPGVVRVHEIGETPEGELFLAMELIEGEPLSGLLDRRFPAPLAVSLARQAAAALGAAHAAGLVHRDVKPANLLLQPDGRLRVVDFGLARQADATGGPGGADDRVTATGAVLGTPAYMAPEQVSGAAVGPPADVFALGILLYRLLSGVHPFARESASATAVALASATHVPLGDVLPDAPPALAALVDRCLALDPGKRFADAGALADALGLISASPSDSPDLAADLAALRAQPTPARESITGGGTPPRASLPAATPASPAPRAPATLGSRRLTPWLLGGLVLVGGVFLATRPEPAPGPAPAPASATPPEPRPAGGLPANGAAARPLLPPRPVVAVLGFEAPADDPDDPRGLVLADALRLALDTAPEKLVSVPLSVLDGTLPPAESPGPATPLSRLRRPHRGPGHVDFVVTGRLIDTPDGNEPVQVHVRDTVSGADLRSFTVTGVDDPVALAWQLAPALADVFGVALPTGVDPPTRSANAWGAWLLARRAMRAGEFEAFERNLAFALQLDPGFTLARLDRLQMLRANRDAGPLLEESKALATALEGSTQADHLKDLASAWEALGRGDSKQALRRLSRVLERFPADADALHVLLALRFHDADVRDLNEVERLARDLLALAPRSEEAASRLVRALSWRGRTLEADAALAGLGLPPDDPAFLEVFAEQDLYAGRYTPALEKFRAALTRSPDDLYAEHMGFAARMLSGDCPGAAVAALDRIDRIETTGKNANLDWTYSLAVQGLICAERWDQARSLFDRWSEHSASGREQVMLLRPRVDLAAGVAPEKVERAVLALLSQKSLPGSARGDLMAVLARVGQSPAPLKRLAAEAEAAALDTKATPQQRSSWLRAGRLLSLREARLSGRTDEALAGHARLVSETSEIRGEGDLGVHVQALAAQAEALSAAGQKAPARAVWAKIVGLGYPRLWVQDLWVLARRRLAAP
jgi:serine/threonine protein kinase/tetratricopeptide (TPR) repeat protein